ncbi:hypothetical protein [Mycolicibacterium gadium]|nr:hypothetical protein [Mycolicibacterium gadium]
MTQKTNVLVLTDTPDRIDYAKLQAGWKLARDTGTAVILHNVCHECPSITTVPPAPAGQSGRVTFEHEDWCPVLAHHQGRQLTPAEQRRHRRYMDGRE